MNALICLDKPTQELTPTERYVVSMSKLSFCAEHEVTKELASLWGPWVEVTTTKKLIQLSVLVGLTAQYLSSEQSAVVDLKKFVVTQLENSDCPASLLNSIRKKETR